MKLKSIALILMTVALPAMAEKVSVNTKGMSLILDVENGKPAQYLYFGTKLNPNDLQNLKVATDGRMDAYPAYGLNSGTFCKLLYGASHRSGVCHKSCCGKYHGK